MKEIVPCLPKISSIPGPRGPSGNGQNGSNGANGVSPISVTTAAFTMVAAGSQVTIAVDNTSWMVVGMPLFIETAGHFLVISVISTTSVRLQVQTSTSNAVISSVIPTGSQVVTGALMVADPTVTTALANRLVTLENATTGNKTLFGSFTPSSSGNHIGDIWYKTDNTNITVTDTLRWDGTAWVNAFKQLSLPDFGLGIRPIIKVATLPATSNYSEGDCVILSTDGLMYRLHNGAWTAALPAGQLTGQIDASTFLVQGTVKTDNLAANCITSDKVGTNQIITTSANIGTAVIKAANIESVSAGSVQAGSLTAVNIAAVVPTGTIGFSPQYGKLFHPTYITGSYSGRFFKTAEFGTSYQDNFNFGNGSAFSFSHPTPVTAYGPGNASWRVNGSPAMCPDENGNLMVQVRGTLIGYAGSILIYYKKNNESTFNALGSVGEYVVTNPTGPVYGRVDISFFRMLSGIQATDAIKFYVAPADGNGNISSTITCRYELDVMCYNW